MSFDKPILQTSNPYKKEGDNSTTRTIYYGEVISIDDATEGGRIKVKGGGTKQWRWWAIKLFTQALTNYLLVGF